MSTVTYDGDHLYDFRTALVSAKARHKERTSILRAVAAESGKRRRRTTEDLRQQVATLHRSGMIPRAIADTLNISDRRCRELLREVSD